ncbi:hypothetical protein DRE_02706 [Drechslerella stenobrocha 248]|uniref:Uncharacterized protein n=1 Tax=Drechslerella stenobrocha 248 TaxID=1043628 RepID=W7I7Q1_9PEZI|nr:hypothetical protein DRE_02706 [Drechslerella stenobrocha 248]
MAETKASTAAAAAALRGKSSSNFGPMESPIRKLSLFPATPNRSVPSSRASSIRFNSPTRAHELRSIREDDDVSTSTIPVSLRRPSSLYRRRSSATPKRPTVGLARSASVNHGRRGSQSYLRRTQSMYAPGATAYSERPFRIEEKPAFLPASSRPGSTPSSPMLRTLRDPDSLGTKRVTGYGRRFPLSLRVNIFDKARTLGRRVSRTLRFSRSPVGKVPVQQVHADLKHYGFTAYPNSLGYSDAGGSRYADTVVHHRVWDSQSYVTTLDNQGPDEFARPPGQDGQSFASASPSRLVVAEPVSAGGKEPEQRRGFTPFRQPADLDGVDSRRVYSALMKSLTKRFSNEGPASEAILEEEEEEESRVRQDSNENPRPSRVSMEKGAENRKPLSEIPPRFANNSLVVEEGEVSEPSTPVANGGVKHMRSDDALFSQIAHPHHVWQEEGDDSTATDGAVAALKELRISPHAAENAADGASESMDHYPKIVLMDHEASGATTGDASILGGATRAQFRTASGKLQENKLKGGSENESESESGGMNVGTLDPVFL